MSPPLICSMLVALILQSPRFLHLLIKNILVSVASVRAKIIIFFPSKTVCITMNRKLYFPLAEERKKWKMISQKPLGSGPEEPHLTISVLSSVAFLLSAFVD